MRRFRFGLKLFGDGLLGLVFFVCVVFDLVGFGEDLVIILGFSFGWLAYRRPLLRARNEMDSWLSRDGAFLVNNWLLVFSAFFVLFATMFPTITEAVTGERL